MEEVGWRGWGGSEVEEVEVEVVGWRWLGGGGGGGGVLLDVQASPRVPVHYGSSDYVPLLGTRESDQTEVLHGSTCQDAPEQMYSSTACSLPASSSRQWPEAAWRILPSPATCHLSPRPSSHAATDTLV